MTILEKILSTEKRITLFQALSFFVTLLFFFYPLVFLAQKAPLIGDHFEQHYPWAAFFSTLIKKGEWPFWTNLIQAGFPIAAESQIGIFYLPNLLFYFLLPVKVAYSHINLFHYLLAAIGTYLYGKKMGLSPIAALFSSSIYLFGGAIGGAFYNMTSLKVLSWMPLSFFFFETYLRTNALRYLAFLTLCLSMSLLAGYVQMASLFFFIAFFYVLVRLHIFKHDMSTHITQWKVWVLLLCVMLITIVLASPQLYILKNLAVHSNRAGVQEHFAYVGSLSPFAWISFWYPPAQRILHGNNLYIGTYTLFLVILAFVIRDSRYQEQLKLWLTLAVLSFLFALGKWSPIYILFVKLTNFYSFRIPAKFYVFGIYFLSLLAGIGLDKAMRACRKSTSELGDCLKKARNRYLVFLLLFIFTALGIYLFRTIGFQFAHKLGEWYVQAFVYGKAGHPHTMDFYSQKLLSYFGQLDTVYDLSRWMIQRSLLVLATTTAFIFFQITRRWFTPKAVAVALFLILIDLYSQSWIDIQSDYDTYKRADRTNETIEYLREETRSGRLLRLYGVRNPDFELSIRPNMNMLHNIPMLGGYSPLLNKRFYDAFHKLGNINDSIYIHFPDSEYINARIPLLRSLGISHILTDMKLSSSELNLLKETAATGEKVYYISGSSLAMAHSALSFNTWGEILERIQQPSMYFGNELMLEKSEFLKFGRDSLMQTISENSQCVEIYKSEIRSNYELWKVSCTGAVFFTSMSMWDSGWSAYINGKRAVVVKGFGLFKTVYIPGPGEHTIEFRYNPFSMETNNAG